MFWRGSSRRARNWFHSLLNLQGLKQGNARRFGVGEEDKVRKKATVEAGKRKKEESKSPDGDNIRFPPYKSALVKRCVQERVPREGAS